MKHECIICKKEKEEFEFITNTTICCKCHNLNEKLIKQFKDPNFKEGFLLGMLIGSTFGLTIKYSIHDAINLIFKE